MEIRDPIHGTILVSDAEHAVISSSFYQRLRSIKQLGFSEFSFPGATHNRYLHSLGVFHLAGLVFDNLFAKHEFRSPEKKVLWRQVVKLAALLHDVGHGPLSHTTEEVMPPLADLNVKAYKSLRDDFAFDSASINFDRKANHEDYSIKIITDSPLSEILSKNFADFSPLHVACLIDKTLQHPDDFFVDKDVDFRTILSQIVSSELDVDRMDYLERDAYFCGTSYGKVDLSWLIANILIHVENNNACLGLNRKALYTFDDFLISRHHMHLMVYFHNKSIIYEELLYRYLTSSDCTFFLPADVNEYVKYNDYFLYQHLADSDNEWAQRIANRNPYRVLFELHSTEDNNRLKMMKKAMDSAGIPVILASSSTRLSKYHSPAAVEKSFPIYVVDSYDSGKNAFPIDQSTEIFQKYEEIRLIERLYVVPEQYDKAYKLIREKKL